MNKLSRPILFHQLARIGGLLVALFIALVIFTGYLDFDQLLIGMDTGPLYFMLLSALMGFVIGWFFPLVGGLMLLIAGFNTALYLYAQGHQVHALYIVAAFFSLALPGVFYILAWYTTNDNHEA